MTKNSTLILSLAGVILSAQNTQETLGFSESKIKNQRLSALLGSPYQEYYEVIITNIKRMDKYEGILAAPMCVDIEHKDKKILNATMTVKKIMDMKEEKLSVVMHLKEEGDTRININVNSSGSIISCNNVETLFKYAPTELVHRPLSTLLPSITHQGVSVSIIFITIDHP
jgi:hypothetical protein